MRMTFKECVAAYNINAAEEGLGFRLKYQEDEFMGGFITARLMVVNPNGILYPNNIYITKEKREEMMAFFEHHGIKLRYNNMAQIYWETDKEGDSDEISD